MALLAALWSKQVPAGFFTNRDWLIPGFDRAEAAEAVKDHIDYFCGRAIKTNLSQDQVDPRLYDRDAGQGAFQRAVNSVK